MRWSKAFIPTFKEDPKETEAISHKLMLRAGLIRKLASGTYSYLPLGWRVLNKVIGIVRQEMDAAGAQEVLMPAMHPKELWEKTGRYELLKPDILITYKDRHGKEIVFGPTHEEIITSLIAGEIRSYRQLPQTLYQIQTKFRDEPRPRFGVIRTSEFIMKDAYSFDADWEGLEKSYKTMYDTYCRIFTRCGLKYIPVEADPGMMGGNASHEFMVPAESGEDKIVVCKNCGYAASFDKAECVENSDRKPEHRNQKLKSIEEVSTPGVSTVEKVAHLLKVTPQDLVKTIVFIADGKELAVLVRGDCEVNPVKLGRFLKVNSLSLADEKTIEQITGGPIGFSGPVGLKGVKILADYSVSGLSSFIAGANKKDKHLVNVNLERDFRANNFGDFRFIREEDPCPKCGKTITIITAIEIGHVFKLGTKYTQVLKALFLDAQGAENPLIMGCYGIGVNRIVAASIEQNNDENGIIWNRELCPFEILILPTNMDDAKIKLAAEKAYEGLLKQGASVLMDDRELSAGIKFKDADLLGVPLRLTVGKKFLEAGVIELKERKTGEVTSLEEKEAIEKILDKIDKLQ